MTKDRIHQRTIYREREALQAELERLRILGRLELVAELLSLGMLPEKAFEAARLDPDDLSRLAALDPEIAQALDQLEQAREEGMRSVAALFRSLVVRAERNWHIARYLIETFYMRPRPNQKRP